MIIRAVKRPLLLIVTLIFSVFLLLVSLTKTTGAYAVYYGGTVRKLPIYSVGRSDNKISISFECAWGAEYTEKLLDVLDEYNVKCTFFCVEFWVTKYPETVKKIYERGHEIGTHSKTHPKMSKLSKEQIESELISSSTAIENITGAKVELFRPPFGDYNDNLISVCDNLNLYPIQWSVDSLDWKNISTKDIVNRVVSKTKSGDIILCHNNGKNTYKALPYILSNLKEKGYEFVKISELIYKKNYKINSFGVQIKNDN